MCHVRKISLEGQTSSFSWSLVKGFIFLKRRKINSRCYWRCVLSKMLKRKMCSPFNQQNSFFYDCKKRKACCRAEYSVWGPKTEYYVVWWWSNTLHIALQRKQVVTMTKRNYLYFWRKLFANTNQARPNLGQKKQKSLYYGIIKKNLHLLIQLTKISFPFSFHTLSVYSKATVFSPSPKTVFLGLSNLDQIQLLKL